MARKPVPSNTKNHNGYSADEFQRQLLNWFQDRGLLSDLQAHLRHQMILALRDTSLNINSAGSFHQAGSPKLQAINLLVAEFLLRQECHYTLSVFTSEVPLLRNLPEFSSAINNSDSGGRHETNDQFPGFHERDVFDILEALGFSPNSEESQRINDLYEHSHGESLLTCLIRSLPDKFRSSVKALSEKCESPVPPNKAELQDALLQTPLFTEEIHNIILESNVGSQQISQLHKAVERIVEEEVKKTQKEEEAKYHKMLIAREQRIQELWQQHDEKIQEKMIKAGEKLKEKQTKLSRELCQKQAHLAVLASQLREQQNEVSNRLNYVHERGELLEQKEIELKVQKKESEDYLLKEQQKLEEKEKQIEQQLLRLKAETQARDQERRELEANRIQIEQASQAIKESQSEIALLRDMQRQHSFLLKATEAQYEREEKQADHIRKKILQCSSQAVQVDLQKHKGAIPKRHNVHQQTVRVPCEDQSLQTQISGNDMEDVFMHLRVQSTENERRRSQHEMMNNMIEHLEQENTELRGHIAQQRLRIEELTVQASQLMHHLNEVNNSLARFRSQPATRDTDHQGVQTSPRSDSSPAQPMPNRNPVSSSRANGYQVPPRPAPIQPTVSHGPRTSFHGFTRSNQLGAGEDSYFSRRLPADSYISLPSSSLREQRRKPLRRLMVHSLSSSEESSPSPTEEMLSEARRRLRRLEEETAAVDRSYQEFRLRQVDSLSNSASILFQPVSSEYTASFPGPGLQNTAARPFIPNPLSTPTSSRGRLVQPQVALISQIPSTTVLQPNVLNTSLLYPSTRANEQRQKTYTPSQPQSNTYINPGFRVSAENTPVLKSSLWGRSGLTNVQTSALSSKITDNVSSSIKDARNAMNLPAAFNFNEPPRHRIVERNLVLNTQMSQNVSRPQQEPPPCIVSAPHIPVAVTESETLDENSQFHDSSQLKARLNKGNVSKTKGVANSPVLETHPPSTNKTDVSLQFEVIKDVSMKHYSYNNQHQPFLPIVQSLGHAENHKELLPPEDESKEEDQRTNKCHYELGKQNERETVDEKKSNLKNIPNEEISAEEKILECIESGHTTGESVASLIQNNSSTKEENKIGDNGGLTSSLQVATNNIQRVKTTFEDEDCNLIQTQDSANKAAEPLQVGGPPPVSLADSEGVLLSDREHLSTSCKENQEKTDNVGRDSETCDTNVPLDVVQNNNTLDSVSNNVLKLSPVKSESHEERAMDGLLNDSLKEHSKSPSSPSVIGSSNEVSSDVISAGTPGKEKSDESW